MVDTEQPEPMDGITDAIQAADSWIAFARAHRDWPEKASYRARIMADRADLIAKLQRLGPVGEEG